MSNLQGKIAVVTGASRGLGRRIAVRLGVEGATVAILARSAAGLEETRREISARGAHAFVVPVDIGKPDSVKEAKAAIEHDLGIPSVLVNAAGIFGPLALIKRWRSRRLDRDSDDQYRWPILDVQGICRRND